MSSEHGERLEDNLLRQRLSDGSFLRSMRDPAPGGVAFRSDEELERMLDETLAHRPPRADLHVFGCGSLMWNPAMDFAHRTVGTVMGWHRAFCFELFIGRGSAEAPGAMLALDRGGACRGVLYTIAASKVAQEARLLWRREMLAGSYRARWVPVHTGTTRCLALAFVADRNHRRYIGAEPIERVAALIRGGRGAFGTSREYFESTLHTLHGLGIRDAGMERLAKAVRLGDAAESQWQRT